MRKVDLERFWGKVRYSPGCWLWRGAPDRNGYGSFWLSGFGERAHRVAYRIAYGEIPSGEMVLHSCDTPGCVYFGHLRAGTALDNSLDMHGRGRFPGLAEWQVQGIQRYMLLGKTQREVATLCLCSISSVQRAWAEIRKSS